MVRTMKELSFLILRIGIGITFIWIGILILTYPAGWAGFLPPWTSNLLPFDQNALLVITAIFDISIGILLLVNYFTWLASLLGSVHLAGILIISGIDAVTVRDIGLLAGTLALFINSAPKNLMEALASIKLKNLQRNKEVVI